MMLFQRSWFGKKETLIPADADRSLRKKLKQLETKRKQHHQAENSAAEAKTLDETGMILFKNKYYDAARDRWKDALRIYQETNDRPSMAELYSNTGTAFRQEGNLREAARFYNKSLQLDRDFNKGQGEIISLHNLGSAWIELSEYDTAVESYGEALDIARDHKLGEWESDTLYRLGYTYRHLYRQLEAFRFFESGLKIAESLKNLPLITLNIFGLGNVYEDIGEYMQALACYDNAQQGAENLQNKSLQADILTRTSSLKLHIGYLDEAREIARTANDLIPEDEPNYVRVELDLLKSDIYYSRGMKENSISLVDNALQMAAKLPNKRGYVQAKIRQVIMEIDRNRFKTASDIIQSLDNSEQSTNNNMTEIERLIVLCRIFWGKEQEEKALQVAEIATIKADETRIPKLIWQTRYQLGRIFEKQQKFQIARNEYERAEKTVNRIAMTLDPPVRKTFLAHKERQTFYQDYILLLDKLGHKEQAQRILNRVDSDVLNKKIKHFINN